MLKNDHFYNRTIRKVVVAFGTIFNDIEIVRFKKDNTPKERMKVPLSYGPKEKYITRIKSDPTLTKSVAVTLPRMAFELTGLSYDASRKQQTTIQNFYYSTGSVKHQYVPVPYNFEFSLSIFVRNTEDGTQILEQILPFFTPDFTVTVAFNPELGQKHDIPIILDSVSTSVDYEGDMTSSRVIIWDLTFTAKGFLWPAVKQDQGLIGQYSAYSGEYGQAYTNIYVEHQLKDAQKVYVDYANGSNYFTTDEIIRVKERGVYGKMKYFSNTSTGTVVLSELNTLVEPGDKIRGDYSGAVYTVVSVDHDPFKAVTIITEPVPEDADPDDEFGFKETIIEWPDNL